MKVLQLRSCCCGCSLRLGTIIIGWANLIVIVSWLYLITFGRDYYHPSDTTTEILSFVYVALFSCPSFLLLTGVYQEKPTRVIIWATYFFTLMLLNVVGCTIELFKSPRLDLLPAFLLIGLELYSVLVAYSYYRTTQKRPKPQPSLIV